jgi:hypothetical protein
MGFMDSGIAKARAAASDARADLAHTSSKLPTAAAKLQLATAADNAVDWVSHSWLGRQQPLVPLVDAAKSQTNALRTRAIADVDELNAQRELAESRLKMAEKSQKVAEKSKQAMQRVAEETDKLIGD